MSQELEENNKSIPDINFKEIVKYQGRSSSTVERQVTVARYRTYSTFNFDQVQTAAQKCSIKASDDFGVIGVRTSEDRVDSDDPTQDPEHIRLDIGEKWVRALYALIGDRPFRWLDFETKDIFEYLIEGVLDETFLIEYYQDKRGELRFLTYGGSRYSERINSKHRFGFGMQFAAIQEEFSHNFIRKACSRPEFIRNLKRISYDPEGEAGYGTVETASMKTKYQNVIDPDARRVKEILENHKILVNEFVSKFSMYSPFVSGDLSMRFEISVNGRVILYLPEIKFPRPLTEIEREDIFYEIVRSAYAFIIDRTTSDSYDEFSIAIPPGQLLFDFLQDVK